MEKYQMGVKKVIADFEFFNEEYRFCFHYRIAKISCVYFNIDFEGRFFFFFIIMDGYR